MSVNSGRALRKNTTAFPPSSRPAIGPEGDRVLHMHTVLCGLDRRPSVEALEGEVSALRQQIMELNRREVENLQELRQQLQRQLQQSPQIDWHDESLEPTRLFGTDPLNPAEKVVDEHIRTTCLAVIATAVIFAALYYLRSILVPLFLAIAIAHLLLPMIDWLNRKRYILCVPYKIPRGIAVLITVLFALFIVFNIGLLIAESVAVFAKNAEQYNKRVSQILDLAFELSDEAQMELERRTAEAKASVAGTYNAAAEAVSSVTEDATDLLTWATGSDGELPVNDTAAANGIFTPPSAPPALAALSFTPSFTPSFPPPALAAWGFGHHVGRALRDTTTSLLNDTFIATAGVATNGTAGYATDHDQQIYQAFKEAFNEINLSSLISDLLGSAVHVIKDLVYIVLFLMFMLLGSHGVPDEEEKHASAHHGADRRGPDDEEKRTQRERRAVRSVDTVRADRSLYREASGMDGVALMHSAAQAQVSKYIQGKVIIALVVAGVHAAVLFYVGLELFLVFGLLSFALNFVPAIGMYISILLPMPLVVLDDAFTPMEALLAFVLPLLIGLAAKDVMEPLLIGSATRLQPVAMLLATLLWGGIWGITGMVRGPRCAQNCAA